MTLPPARCYTILVSQSSTYARRMHALALFVRGLTRYGWIPLVALMLIAWLLEWGSLRQILAIGIAAALVILLSPMMLGVVAALASRRHAENQASRDR